MCSQPQGACTCECGVCVCVGGGEDGRASDGVYVFTTPGHLHM